MENTLDVFVANLPYVLPMVLLANIVVAPIGALIILRLGVKWWFGLFAVGALLALWLAGIDFTYWLLSTVWYIVAFALPAYLIVKIGKLDRRWGKNKEKELS